MKSFIYICFMSSVILLTNGFNITEDLYMFLPFIKDYDPAPLCPPNEIYKRCMGNCSDCTQRGACVIEKCIKGCDCAPRFFRTEPGGPCEPVGNCPEPECGDNEVFRECGPVCERCTTFRCKIISCDHKCYCKKGHLRNAEGVCIPESECPKRKRCTHTEEWAESGAVDEFCFHQLNYTQRNETQEIPKCYCKEGYKRNALGICIVEKNCHSFKCAEVEIYHECVPRCNTTCRNYGDPNCTEDSNCFEGCFCPPGYVMNDFRTCVPIEECSPETEHILVFEAEAYEDEFTEEETTTGELDGITKSTGSSDLDDSDEGFKKDVVDSVYENETSESNVGIMTSEITPTPVFSTKATTTDLPKKQVTKETGVDNENI